MKRSGFKLKPRKPLKRTSFKVTRVSSLSSNTTTSLRKVGKTTLHKKAWAVFSKWVRERDKRCVTCGSTNGLQAGHFWHNCLDFDEININAQCSQCNHYMSGNLAPYSVYLIRKYGKEAFEELEKRHWLALRGEIRTEKDYLDIIDKYKLL